MNKKPIEIRQDAILDILVMAQALGFVSKDKIDEAVEQLKKYQDAEGLLDGKLMYDPLGDIVPNVPFLEHEQGETWFVPMTHNGNAEPEIIDLNIDWLD